jgi:hypothetical protein
MKTSELELNWLDWALRLSVQYYCQFDGLASFFLDFHRHLLTYDVGFYAFYANVFLSYYCSHLQVHCTQRLSLPVNRWCLQLPVVCISLKDFIQAKLKSNKKEWNFLASKQVIIFSKITVNYWQNHLYTGVKKNK